MPIPDTSGGPESIVRWFAEGWDDPGSLDALCAHFLPGVRPDVRLIQPGTGVLTGHEGFRRLFALPFAVLTEIRIDVERWAASGDDVYIEYEMSGCLGPRRVSWTGANRLTFRDGLLAERIAWFDPTVLLGAIARRPASWARAAAALGAARRG